MACEDLMGVDAGIELLRLAHQVAELPSRLMRCTVTLLGAVECGQQVFAGAVDAGVDRPRGERLRLAVRRQGAGGAVDAKRVRDVLVAADAGSAVARTT